MVSAQADSSNKVRMKVEFRLLKVSVPVSEPKAVFVEWCRQKTNFPTHKKTVDSTNSIVEFGRKEACCQMSVGFVKQADDSWQADNNKLVLHCGDEVVGTCHINIANYIN